ncbi:hypothetical protein GWK47_011478 [Chionoecetes opilio]|uniref:Uncharacterized protein n=1 Tax=Chionoecetes opilio TaxID=41210 RepID=A0A8J5C2K9_CHIOP|nr:hypothetical protein GWK47_011478 [Chionoecetes opilio]
MPAQPTLTDVRSWFGLVNRSRPSWRSPLSWTLQGATQETGWEGSVRDKQLGRSSPPPKTLLGDFGGRGTGASMMCRALHQSSLTKSRQGIGFLVLQQYCECVSEKSPLCSLAGGNLCSVAADLSQRPRGTTRTLGGEALAIAWA